MSQQVIRINSVQGYADQWTPGIGGAPPSTLDLLDFVIPRGMTADLSKSYISINVETSQNQGGVFNNGLFLDVYSAEPINAPTSALVRNCSIQCDRGMIESIRRQDTLACALHAMTNDAEDSKGDMNIIGTFTDQRGVGNKTSYMLDCVVDNTLADGSGVDGRTSKQISRDLKIPIQDIFRGIGSAEDYSTNVFGETRIHCEMNTSKLYTQKLGGAEDVDLFFGEAAGGITFGDLEDKTLTASQEVTVLDLDADYTGLDVNLTCPFFVGQSVFLNGSVSIGGAAAAPFAEKSGIIQQIKTKIVTGEVAIEITFENAIYTAAAGAGEDLTLLKIKADTTQINTLTVNNAELVLFTKEENDPSQTFDYMTFTSELDNGNSLTDFHRQYMIEPNCKNLFVAHCLDGRILPNKDITDYRISIDNEDQTGNRSVVTGQPLQYDRLERCLNSNSEFEWKNAQMKFYKNDNTQALAYASPVSIICETMPTTPTNKKVGLEIASSGVQTLILYKQLPKTI